MFNSEAVFTTQIISGDLRSCRMRFPTDAEWADRTRSQQFIEKDLGRGESVRQANDTEKSDLALFEKIREDEPRQEFDEYEASAFIQRLEECDVTDISREGNVYRIEMTVMRNIIVVHRLRLPKQSEMAEYRRASPVRRRIGHGYEKVQVALEPSADLWNKLKVDAEGYKASVPNIHKNTAVTALIREYNRLLDDPE